MPTATRRRRRQEPDYSRPLTREKIAGAAIEIVRSEGENALSMRKVAGCFGVDVAALYRHFRNKDELLAHVGVVAAAGIALDVSEAGAWDERLRALAQDVRHRIAEHPELGINDSASPWATPFFARANGLIAGLLCEAGLEGERLVFATQTVLHLVTSVAQSEVMAGNTPPADNRGFARTIREHLPEEAREVWPSTRGRKDWTVDFDDFFAFALEATIAGVTQPED